MCILSKNEYKLLKFISKNEFIPLDYSESVKSLLSNGYINSYVDANNYLSPIRFYSITLKGKSILEERFYKQLSFVFASIILPIIFMIISHYFF